MVNVSYIVTLMSLVPPERDERLEQIDQNFAHTFNWAYEDPSIGLSQWLRKGIGIFWISGKPGSGKSTFMKFLLNDCRTGELVYSWKSKSQIVASFFFHHRGTHLQKSFDGLLRSLLSQILEKEPRLFPAVGAVLDVRLQKSLVLEKHGLLQSDVRRFFRLCGISSTSTVHQERLVALLSRDPVLQLDTILSKIDPPISKAEKVRIKSTVLRDFASLLNSIGKGEIHSHEMKRRWAELRGVQSETLSRNNNAWFEVVDIEDQIRKFLIRHKLCKGVLDEDCNKHIRQLAERQRVRQRSRLETQLAQWTRSDLEQGLQHVLGQNVLDLDLCLFFDALDEYDGPPEMISEFLKSLVVLSPTSKTRARILFSSRPWPVFVEAFNNCPGLRIHEHTREDIHRYCAGSLPDDGRARAVLLPMVEEITTRARGVFLWVMLVMRDLALVATTEHGTDEYLSSKLRDRLDSIPDELNDYYSTIIQRLPLDTRRETYVLLECLSRSATKLYIDQIPRLVACGLSGSPADAEMLQSDYLTRVADPHSYVRRISGGLVDIVRVPPHPFDFPPGKRAFKFGEYTLQPMHQTCKEWIESPTFKYIVLGDHANTTWENGHSFVAKYSTYEICYRNKGQYGLFESQEAVYHVKEAERTTGVSQYPYISRLPLRPLGLPPGIFPGAFSRSILLTAWVAAAIHNQWWLFLKDCLLHDKPVFEKPEPLFTLLIREKSKLGDTRQEDTTIQVLVEMGKLLLAHGFKLERDPSGLAKLVNAIWESPDRQIAQQYIDLVIAALQGSLPMEVFLYFPNASAEGHVADPTDTVVTWKLLHLSPPALARWLLENGADVNGLNSQGRTPLEYVLDPESVHQECHFGMDWLYEVVCLLVHHGASLPRKQIRAEERESLLQRLSAAGYDISMLSSLRPDVHKSRTDRARDKFKKKLGIPP